MLTARQAAAMWCDRCRAEVAAEVAADTGRAACGTCGGDLGPTRRPATEEARELLRRWSGEVAAAGRIDPPMAAPASDSEPASVRIRRPPRQPAASRDPAAGLRLRIDDPHESPSGTGPTPEPQAAPVAVPFPGTASAPDSRPTERRAAVRPPIFAAERPAVAEDSPQVERQKHARRRTDRPASEDREEPRPRRRRRTDGPHGDGPRGGGPSPPHFDVHTAIATHTGRGGSGSQLVGQIMAYSGVLALTLGTALVIWGYFGGPADYAPTGWLIATGGQMLLFLGVVTLISGGLEQTSRDVRVRVESLGERLIRIEQAAAGHGLRGPHGPPERFAGREGDTHRDRERV